MAGKSLHRKSALPLALILFICASCPRTGRGRPHRTYHRIRLRGVLSFAGLRDRWKNPETGEPVISCTIIVTEANALTRPIHDRMPVILNKADIGPWLSGAAGA